MKGHIQPRGEGVWRVMYTAGRDGDGKRQQRSFTVKGTKRQAEAELRRVLREIDTRTYVDPSKLTLGAYLDQWLRDLEELKRRPKTIQTYGGLIRNSIRPYLGAKPLQEITASDIKSFYLKLARAGRKDGSGGLSAQTVKHVHRVLSEALKEAAQFDKILFNPCDKLKKKDMPKVEATERKPLTDEETTRLLALAEGTRVHLPVLLAVATGMRRGEVLGLRWQDVDLDAGEIRVRKQLSSTAGRLEFAEPKSGKGKRPIPLPSPAVEALRRHKGQQAAHRLQWGEAYRNHDLVIAQEGGTPWHPDGLSHAFRLFLQGTDLPRVRFHDLRHGHASQLIKRGADFKTVSERLGHSSIAITVDLYTHGDNEGRRKAANSLTDLFPTTADEGSRRTAQGE